MQDIGLRCRKCGHRSTDVRPVPTSDGSDQYECLDVQACKNRKKWLDFAKRRKRQAK